MISSVLVLMKITNLIKNKLLDATRNNEKNVTNGAPEEGAPLLSEKKLLMAHQRRVRHCYQKKNY